MRFGAARTLAVQQPLSLRALGIPRRRSSAAAPIGTPLLLGTGSANNTIPVDIVTTPASLAGDLIVVMEHSGGAQTPSTPTDTFGNTYAQASTISSGNNRSKLYASPNSAVVPAAGPITTNYLGATGIKIGIAVAISGIATTSPLDASAQPATQGPTAQTSATITSNTLAQANSLVLVGLVRVGDSSDGAPSTPSGWTLLGSKVQTGSTAYLYGIIVAATTAVTFASTWVTARDITLQMNIYKGATP